MKFVRIKQIVTVDKVVFTDNFEEAEKVAINDYEQGLISFNPDEGANIRVSFEDCTEEYLQTDEWASSICDAFENLLEKHKLDIPSEDRDAEEHKEGLAHLYGEDYYSLKDEIQDILNKFINNAMSLGK